MIYLERQVLLVKPNGVETVLRQKGEYCTQKVGTMSFPDRLRLNNKLAYYKNQMEVRYSYLRVIDGMQFYSP